MNTAAPSLVPPRSITLVMGYGFGAKQLEAALKARVPRVQVYRPGAAPDGGDTLARADLPAAFAESDGIVISPLVSDFLAQTYYEIIDLARTSPARRITFTSLSGADPKSPIRLLQRFGVLEQRVLAQDNPKEHRVAVMRTAPILQGLWHFAVRTPRGLSFETPFCDKALSWVDFEDVMEAGYAAMSVAELRQSIYRIKGPEALSVGQLVARLSAVLGQPIEHHSITVYEAQGMLERAGYPAAYTRIVSEWWDAMVGGLIEVHDSCDFHLLTGRRLRTLEESAPSLLQMAGFLPTTKLPCTV